MYCYGCLLFINSFIFVLEFINFITSALCLPALCGYRQRKNLRNHLDEKRMEYLELKMDTMQGCMLEESVKQKENISELNTTIKTMSRKMKSLEQEVEILTKLSKAVKLVWQITKIPVYGYFSSLKLFQVAGYNLLFYFIILPTII